MVKNTHGGNRHKGMARKNMNSGNSNRLRVAIEEDEIYAVVTKHLGNNMFHCLCMDGTTRLGHIRGKFSGRRKGHNLVLPGIFILIGIREWESGEKSERVINGKAKFSECDLLEVYSKRDAEVLTETIDLDWKQLESAVPSSMQGHNADFDDVRFISEKDEERERLLKEMEDMTASKVSLTLDDGLEYAENTDDEINIEDI
jgi:initiation factor 1A